MKEINEIQIKILTGILESCYDDQAAGYDSFEDWTDVKRKDLKPLLLDLRNKGFVTYERGLMTDDGQTAGAGYCITYKGKCFVNPCDLCGHEAIFDYDGKKECQDHYNKSTKNEK